MSTSRLKICRCEVSGPAPEQQRMSSFAFGFYKLFISPLLHAITPTQCKFLPTCSEYAYIAVSRFGAMQGSRLALRRVLRCHPWAKGGVDPVPDFEAH